MDEYVFAVELGADCFYLVVARLMCSLETCFDSVGEVVQIFCHTLEVDSFPG